MRLAGIVLAILVLASYAGAIRIIVRAPFRALGILVAGMAFHNLLLMIMLRLQTPALLIRVVQAWKEGIILLLLVLAARLALQRWRSRSLPRLRGLDMLVGAFVVLAIVYVIVPPLVGTGVTPSQQVVGLRIVLLLPLMYAFGRVFSPRDRGDLGWVAGVILGSAAVVGLFGLWELWFVPTSTWLSWGVNQLSAWWGYSYTGPKGLPENFFQTTVEGYLLRRMVSTYVSPLGIAYTGVLIVPIAAAVLASRWPPSRWPRVAVWAASALVIIGIFFSVTRLAIAVCLFELVALTILLRRAYLAGATVLATAFALFIVFSYADVGPLLTRDLQAVPASAHRHLIGQRDASLTEHNVALRADIDYVVAHPLGTGIGSSVHRYGPNTGTGESAIFDMFGDMGALGGALYLSIYGVVLVAAGRACLRSRANPLGTMLPMAAFVGGLALLPITLTSSVWGDFSVTFLFWWAAGASATQARATGRSAHPLASAAAVSA